MKVDRDEIEGLITPIVEAMGYVVWNIELHRAQHKILLRVYVDVPFGDNRKGVSLDDCGNISNQIGGLLDAEEVISGSYTLEVSSPGLARSLFKPEHYERYIGNMVHINLHKSIDERHDFKGKIQEVLGSTLKLLIDGQVIDVDMTNISKAKLIPDL